MSKVNLANKINIIGNFKTIDRISQANIELNKQRDINETIKTPNNILYTRTIDLNFKSNEDIIYRNEIFEENLIVSASRFNYETHRSNKTLVDYKNLNGNLFREVGIKKNFKKILYEIPIMKSLNKLKKKKNSKMIIIQNT